MLYLFAVARVGDNVGFNARLCCIFPQKATSRPFLEMAGSKPAVGSHNSLSIRAFYNHIPRHRSKLLVKSQEAVEVSRSVLLLVNKASQDLSFFEASPNPIFD